MDQRIKKLMTMHKALYPRDIDRLYVSRKGGGRELTSIEDWVSTLSYKDLRTIWRRVKKDYLQ